MSPGQRVKKRAIILLLICPLTTLNIKKQDVCVWQKPYQAFRQNIAYNLRRTRIVTACAAKGIGSVLKFSKAPDGAAWAERKMRASGIIVSTLGDHDPSTVTKVIEIST